MDDRTAAFPVSIPPLREVQRWMAFMGWHGDAATGFDCKRDVSGAVIARCPDATWHVDVEEATLKAAREQRAAAVERFARARATRAA